MWSLSPDGDRGVRGVGVDAPLCGLCPQMETELCVVCGRRLKSMFMKQHVATAHRNAGEEEGRGADGVTGEGEGASAADPPSSGVTPSGRVRRKAAVV